VHGVVELKISFNSFATIYTFSPVVYALVKCFLSVVNTMRDIAG